MSQIIVRHPTDKSRKFVCSSRKEADELKARLAKEAQQAPEPEEEEVEIASKPAATSGKP